MLTQVLDQDQAQRLEQDAAVEAFFLDGVHDGFEGNKPQYSEITYLQGYRHGMQNFKAQSQHLVPELEREMALVNESSELPLICGQCAHLIDGRCTIKSVARNSNQYACSSICVDCPF